MGDTKPTSFKKERRKSGPDRRAENKPSEVDDLTHKELCILYEETSGHIVFAKTQQWRTFGATLVIFAVILGVAKYISNEEVFMKMLSGSVILITLTAISVMIIYQFWQHTEQKKLLGISQHFSSVFRSIRGYKSKREAGVHRYLLLIFMISGLIIGATIVNMGMYRTLYTL